MLYVKTKIGNSLIHGIGLFADQFIPQNTIVWKHNDLIDRVYRYEQLNDMEPIVRATINYYGWLEGEYFVVPGDNARFINHSNEPNCIPAPGVSIAVRDIQLGEEITEDYASFDEEHELYINQLS